MLASPWGVSLVYSASLSPLKMATTVIDFWVKSQKWTIRACCLNPMTLLTRYGGEKEKYNVRRTRKRLTSAGILQKIFPPFSANK